MWVSHGVHIESCCLNKLQTSAWLQVKIQKSMQIKSRVIKVWHLKKKTRNVEIAGNEYCAGGSNGVVLKEKPQGWHSLSYIGLKVKLLWIQSYRFYESNVYWTVHRCNSWRMKGQLDVTCYFISLLMWNKIASDIKLVFHSSTTDFTLTGPQHYHKIGESILEHKNSIWSIQRIPNGGAAGLQPLLEIEIIYRVIRNDCRGFNSLSYTIHLRLEYMYFLFNRTTLQDFVTYLIGALYVVLLNKKIQGYSKWLSGF